MNKIIGDYDHFIRQADELLVSQGIELDEVVQLDTICYRVETNDRYAELKQQLALVALLISETEVNGRLVAVFEPYQPLRTQNWNTISYVELPQPKPGSFYPEGIDHVQYVTRRGLSDFYKVHSDVAFEDKGLASQLNPLLKLTGASVSVKFHDKHMGAVIELEHRS